ncbi:MAG: hypothetical protein N3D11_16470 [Candidatus Sumerlaeia bacterium]|nr:hypothetical protein [Candidatus Sumerlaeia bacterium]
MKSYLSLGTAPKNGCSHGGKNQPKRRSAVQFGLEIRVHRPLQFKLSFVVRGSCFHIPFIVYISA